MCVFCIFEHNHLMDDVDARVSQYTLHQMFHGYVFVCAQVSAMPKYVLAHCALYLHCMYPSHHTLHHLFPTLLPGKIAWNAQLLDSDPSPK